MQEERTSRLTRNRSTQQLQASPDPSLAIASYHSLMTRQRSFPILRKKRSVKELREEEDVAQRQHRLEINRRFARRTSFLRMEPPHQVTHDLELLSQSCIDRIRTDEPGYKKKPMENNDPFLAGFRTPKSLFRAQKPNSPLILIPTVHLPTAYSSLSRYINIPSAEMDETHRPDGWVAPSMLLKPAAMGKDGSRERWIGDLLRYGDNEREQIPTGLKDDFKPDIFSRCHDMTMRANGKEIVVTVHRQYKHSARSNPTHVYVSPGMAVDLKPLGEAALLFEKEFDYLFGPKRIYHQGGCIRIPEPDAACEHGEEVEIEVATNEKPFTCPIPLIKAEPWTPTLALRVSQVLSGQDVKYLLGQTARSTSIPVVLEPGAHERYPGYNARFHTYARGSASIFEEEVHANVKEPTHEIAKDMRWICATTGGLGCTFQFRVDNDGKVHGDVYASWQFWDIHRPLLVRLANIIYAGISHSLVVTYVVRSTVKASGYRLPKRHTFLGRSSELGGVRDEDGDKLPEPVFNRYKFSNRTVELPWNGFPSPGERYRQRSTLFDLENRAKYNEEYRQTRLKLEAQQERLRQLASIPATPTRVTTGLRPMMMGTGYTSTSTLVDTPQASMYDARL